MELLKKVREEYFLQYEDRPNYETTGGGGPPFPMGETGRLGKEILSFYG